MKQTTIVVEIGLDGHGQQLVLIAERGDPFKGAVHAGQCHDGAVLVIGPEGPAWDDPCGIGMDDGDVVLVDKFLQAFLTEEEIPSEVAGGFQGGRGGPG